MDAVWIIGTQYLVREWGDEEEVWGPDVDASDCTQYGFFSSPKEAQQKCDQMNSDQYLQYVESEQNSRDRLQKENTRIQYENENKAILRGMGRDVLPDSPLHVLEVRTFSEWQETLWRERFVPVKLYRGTLDG